MFRPHIGGRPIHLWPAGDMDGDGVSDLMRLRPHGLWYDVSAYSSRTGRALWGDTSASDIAIPLDRPGRNAGGVLLAQTTAAVSSPNGAEVTLTLVDMGPNGVVRWSNSRTGAITVTPGTVQLVRDPYVADLDRYLPDRGEALLVGQATANIIFTPVGLDWRGSQDVSYLAIADGSLTHAAYSVSPAGPQGLSALSQLRRTAPACFSVDQQMSGDTTQIVVYCGTHRAWAATVPQGWVGLYPAGDLNGDHVTDLYAVGDQLGLAIDPIPNDPGLIGGPAGKLLISGGNGRTLPDHLPDHQWITPVGAPHHRGKPRFEYDSAVFPTSTSITWDVTEVTQTGAVQVHRSLTQRLRRPIGFGQAFFAGDIDGDGTTDLEFTAWANGATWEQGPDRSLDLLTGSGTVVGGQGSLLPESSTGHGEDRASMWSRRGRIDWTLRTGDGRRLLSSGSARDKGGLPPGDPEAVITVHGHPFLFWVADDRVGALDIRAHRVAWVSAA
ncbi:MAG: hypothetical protein JO222_14055 [Frankiales bacterium]|nr:hypothetical protein [Frankiales bacterium]